MSKENRIIDELVKYETALLAKEIGFDREVQYYFDEGKVINTWHSINPLFAKRLGLILAPSQSLLSKWFREIHGVLIEVRYRFTVMENVVWDVRVWHKDFTNQESLIFYPKETYELALEAGLLGAAEYVKSKMKWIHKTQALKYLEAQRKALDEFEEKEEPIKEKEEEEPALPPQYGYYLLKVGDKPDKKLGDQFFDNNDGCWKDTAHTREYYTIKDIDAIYRRPIPIPDGFELVPEDEDANSIEYMWWDSKSKTWISFLLARGKAKEFLAVIRKKEPATPTPPEGFYIETNGEYAAQKVDMYYSNVRRRWEPVAGVERDKIKDLMNGDFIARPIKKDNILTATQWLKTHQWDKKFTNDHFQEILHLIELARKEGRNEGITEALELAAKKSDNMSHWVNIDSQVIPNLKKHWSILTHLKEFLLMATSKHPNMILKK